LDVPVKKKIVSTTTRAVRRQPVFRRGQRQETKQKADKKKEYVPRRQRFAGNECFAEDRGGDKGAERFGERDGFVAGKVPRKPL
jgi:phage gp45-like